MKPKAVVFASINSDVDKLYQAEFNSLKAACDKALHKADFQVSPMTQTRYATATKALYDSLQQLEELLRPELTTGAEKPRPAASEQRKLAIETFQGCLKRHEVKAEARAD